MASEKKGLVFDMDGTLWDSSVQVAESWQTAVREHGYPERVITAKDVSSVMGKTMDVIGNILFADVEDPKYRAELMNICMDAENRYLLIHGGVLYPELEKTLQLLRETYRLFIVSNCQSGYIEAFLEHYGFGYLFEDIECFGNNHLSKGENIALLCRRNHLTDAAYVGDIQSDYDSTMEAGIHFIHAAYGFGTIRQKVVRIQSFAELPEAAGKVFQKNESIAPPNKGVGLG